MSPVHEEPIALSTVRGDCAAAGVGGLYLWKNTRTTPLAETTDSGAGRRSRFLLTALDREFTTLVNQVLPSVVSIEAIPADDVDPRLQMLRFSLAETSRAPARVDRA